MEECYKSFRPDDCTQLKPHHGTLKPLKALKVKTCPVGSLIFMTVGRKWAAVLYGEYTATILFSRSPKQYHADPSSVP